MKNEMVFFFLSFFLLHVELFYFCCYLRSFKIYHWVSDLILYRSLLTHEKCVSWLEQASFYIRSITLWPFWTYFPRDIILGWRREERWRKAFRKRKRNNNFRVFIDFPVAFRTKRKLRNFQPVYDQVPYHWTTFPLRAPRLVIAI